ncbi:hypothetical protein ACH4S9_11775 [Streptomyces sp. NPDC021225]|uniref:hypothetical protein n=1 Tax=Streptomyces sp. NPDC021225 TaxID=3365121 RepID=UPI0037A52484
MSRTTTIRPSRTARPLRTELRRGIGPAVGAATLAALLLAMYERADSWLAGWTDTTDMLRSAGVLVGGPLAAAAACWQGGRERRRGTEELLATVARGRLRRTLLTAAPTILWPVVGYLLTAAVCLAATWRYASGVGGPYPSMIAADAMAIGSFAALGFIAGRLVPWRLAPPLVAFVVFAVDPFVANQDSPVAWLSPGKNHIFSWDRPVWWFGPASMVWTAGLAAAALLAYAARRRARALALAPLAAAATAAVLIVQTGDGVWRPDPASAALVCDDGTPRVCASRAHDRMLPDASAALAGLSAKLRGVPNAPTRIVESRGDHHRGPRTDAALFGWDYYFRRNRIVEPEMFAANAALGATAPSCPGVSDEDRYNDLSQAVAEWLAPMPRPEPPAGQDAPGYTRDLERLKAMPDRERTHWLGTYFAAARSCRLEQVTAP